MNIWTFTARLGADAELRTTSSGEKVLGFRVANDIGFGDRKTTQWVDCSLWGKRAESLAPYLTKGTQVVVSGEVTIREFEKRDGTRGAGLAVRVAEVDFTGSKRDDAPAGERGGYGQHTKHHEEKANGYAPQGGYSAGRTGAGQHPADLDDEIPFSPCR